MLYNKDMSDKKTSTKPRKLTLKQKLFAENYVANRGNATQAAVDAGYGERSATMIGSTNLRKPIIQDAIQDALVKSGLSVDEASKKLGRAIHYGMGEKPTNSDALRGLDMVFKLHGAYPDKKVQVESRSISLSLKGDSMDDLGGKLDELLAESNRIRDTVVVEEETTGQDEDTTS